VAPCQSARAKCASGLQQTVDVAKVSKTCNDVSRHRSFNCRAWRGFVQLKLAAVEGPSILQLRSTAFEATSQALVLKLAFAAEASTVEQTREQRGYVLFLFLWTIST
jgi:hypothetical protein